MSAIEKIFAQYGGATVLFARFFSILRQLNGIVAGTLGMSWWRFLLFNAIGAALWVAVWVFAAAYFTEHTAVIARLANHTQAVAAVLVDNLYSLCSQSSRAASTQWCMVVMIATLTISPV